jgi:hypothetical protein
MVAAARGMLVVVCRRSGRCVVVWRLLHDWLCGVFGIVGVVHGLGGACRSNMLGVVGVFADISGGV